MAKDDVEQMLFDILQEEILYEFLYDGLEGHGLLETSYFHRRRRCKNEFSTLVKKFVVEDC